MSFPKLISIKLATAFFALVIVSLNSCKHDVDLTGVPEMSFENDIKVILSGNCSMNACHGSDSKSEFPLLTYNDVMTHGEVKAGDARDSKIYEAIIETGDDKMPPTGSLTDLQIKKIYIWIEQGAKDN